MWQIALGQFYSKVKGHIQPDPQRARKVRLLTNRPPRSNMTSRRGLVSACNFSHPSWIAFATPCRLTLLG